MQVNGKAKSIYNDSSGWSGLPKVSKFETYHFQKWKAGDGALINNCIRTGLKV